MAHFQFDVLSDKEFETFVVDLLGEYFDTRIQRYKAGKDGGVDGRFYHIDQEIIIQCKQCSTDISKLKTNLRKEVNTVTLLKPERYILATSLKLSKKNKKDILEIFEGINLVEDDIFGNEDLTDLLNKSPDVLKRNFKLWLTSASVLDIIYNRDIYGRSEFKVNEIRDSLKYYVQTSNHDLAIDKLNKTHCLIITGIPGIGKSTLAENICLYFVAQQFEFIQINDSIEEAEKVFAADRKQIFYFDDFLGRTHLYQIDNNADNKTVNFMRRIIKDPKKRFVLTSRTNILNQGKKLSDLFDINQIQRNEFEISITSLSALDKARILYNHISFSDLPEGFIDKFYQDYNYLKVIRHRNFNPRLIQFITDYNRFESIDENHYWTELFDIIQNPKNIWKHVFESQLDEMSRHIVIGLTLYGKAMPEDDFIKFVNNIFDFFPNTDRSTSVESYLKVLLDSLITRNINWNNKIEFNLYNPSIADFVNNLYLGKTEYIADLICCIDSGAAIDNLNSLSYNNKMPKNQYPLILMAVLKKQLANRLDEGLNPFMISIIKRLKNEDINSFPTLESFINTNIDTWLQEEGKDLEIDQLELLDVLTYFDQFEGVLNKFQSKITYTLLNNDYDQDELEMIGSAIYSLDGDIVKITYRQKCLDYFKSVITDLLLKDSVLSDLDVYEDPSRDGKVKEYLRNSGAYSSEFSNDEFDEIIDEINFDFIHSANVDAMTDYQDEPVKRVSFAEEFKNETDAINDLFDRD